MRTTGKAFTLVELLLAMAVLSALTAVLFPVVDQRRKSKITNKPNLENIAKGAILYGNDFDDRIPIAANGSERNLTNTKDGVLTSYGEQRTDHWPLLLLPYVKSRSVFQDPRRDDRFHIWDRPAHATTDPGYDPYGASYRNQNKFPTFGVNYLFLSPIEAVGTGPNQTRSISKSFNQAKDAARTIFYVPSRRGMIPTAPGDTKGAVADDIRGFYCVNAPGMGHLGQGTRLIIWNNAVPCGLDWCGDLDTTTPGEQRFTNYAYIERVLKGNNVAFLDGHVKFMKDTDMTAGTNYVRAVPNGQQNMEGAVITDKRRYLWNLDDDYLGLYDREGRK